MGVLGLAGVVFSYAVFCAALLGLALTWSLSALQLAAFVAERQEACVGEEAGDASSVSTLWGVLLTQAPHARNGSSTNLAAAAEGGGGGDAATLAALTLHAAQASPGRSAAPAPAPSSVADPVKAASEVESLLLRGQPAAALACAVHAKAWPVALVVARSLGPAEWQATLEAYAEQNLGGGSPLTTFCRVVAGSSSVVPEGSAQAGPAAAAAIARAWTKHAAVLVGHGAGSGKALESLGRLLLGSGGVAAAHTCFALAGLPLEYADAAPHQFALLGASPAAAPRTFASLPAILRTELFTWSRTVGEYGVGWFF